MNKRNRSIRSIINIILIFMIMMFLWSSYSFADISDDATSFIEAGNNATPSGANRAAMNSAVSEIAGLLTGLGIIVAVVVAAILGIQFMIGSTDQQAKVKESIIPYVCGCAVVFGALTIWQLVIRLLNQTNM